MTSATALWIMQAQSAGYQKAPYQVAPTDLEIKTLYTGISRGTERLVFQGDVPVSEHSVMRAPFQEGDFTFPVKYGYAAVGQVLHGDRAGQTVFTLFPHQTGFAVPADMALPVPQNVPANRAILAANMETALNILWDAQISIGDRVVVIGCGVVGALVGYLAARIPATEVILVDIAPERRVLARTLGCDFATPDTVLNAMQGDADVVIHASANEAGLATAIALAGPEAAIIEASWYGTKTATIPLGGRFHQRRLQIISSQVGRIPARQAARWSFARRLGKALALLDDPALDILISGETAFADLADNYGSILRDPATLCHRVCYDP